jgi:hypothetical protein
MNPLLVSLVYGLSLALALALLYLFHARWYWHALSLAAALVLGLVRIPAAYAIPDLLIGAVFLFLFIWGLGLPLFHKRHVARSTERHA